MKLHPLTLCSVVLALTASSLLAAPLVTGQAVCITANGDFATDQCDQIFSSISASYGDGGDYLTVSNLLGAPASSVTGIYFSDDPGLPGYGAFTFDNLAGVNFAGGGAPPRLPGGNSFGFGNNPDPNRVTNTGNVATGINPGESLTIWLGGGNPDDFAEALLAQTVQIGIHVQALGPNGASQSAIFLFAPQSDVPEIPEPGTLTLFGIGGALLAIGHRKIRRS